MRIKLNELVNALNNVIVTTKNDKNMPILKGILFTEDNGVLVLQSTDLVNSSIVNIGCENGIGESFCIEGKPLLDVVKKLKSDYIEFTLNTDKNTVDYKTDKFEGKFELLKAEDFPTLTGIDGNKLKIKATNFLNLVKYTTYATSLDETKPFLAYINLKIVKNTMWVTGLDGYRVAHLEIPVEIYKDKDSTDEVLEYNVKASFLNMVSRRISKENEDVKIVINNKDIVINIEGDIYTSKLYQGEFLDFRSLIPTEFKTYVAVKRKELLENLETLLALKNEGVLKVKFDLKDSNLETSCKNSIGKLKTSIEVGQEGGDITIYFNIEYIINVLKAMESEDVYIQMNEPIGQVIIRPVSEVEKYICMVLPVK